MGHVWEQGSQVWLKEQILLALELGLSWVWGHGQTGSQAVQWLLAERDCVLAG